MNRNISSVSQMKNLKKISLARVDPEVIGFLVDANIPVERLTLTRTNLNLFKENNTIAKLSELKVLEFICVSGFRVFDWIKCLNKLKEFHLRKLDKRCWKESIILVIVKFGTQPNYLLVECCWENFVINDADFNNMLAHVMRRKEKTKLVIEIRALQDKFMMTVSPDTIIKYSDLLEIRFVVCDIELVISQDSNKEIYYKRSNNRGRMSTGGKAPRRFGVVDPLEIQ